MSRSFENALQLISDKIMTIDGWLIKEAAIFTVYLMQQQVRTGILGDIFEIGVFRGKYLATLNLMRQPGEKLIGIDSFAGHARKHHVRQGFDTVFGESIEIDLYTADSSTLEVETIRAMLNGGTARFISIDGSHEAPYVTHDLELAAQVLSFEGIVAVDDLLNPLAIGVSEGFYRFVFETRHGGTLVPFAFCRNKAFLCRRDKQAEYYEATEQYLKDYTRVSSSAYQNNHFDKNGSYFVQSLLGESILVVA